MANHNVAISTQAADALITYGALLLHDSRVSEEDNDVFLDLLEDYFAQSDAALKQDERPELGYQVRLHSLHFFVYNSSCPSRVLGRRDAGEH